MVDSVNITDNQTAVVRMASWAASHFAARRSRAELSDGMPGPEPYCDAVRYPRRLCLGNTKYSLPFRRHQIFGDHPYSKKVFDIDSMQLINMVKTMRDEGTFQNGQSSPAPKMFIGAASNPFGDPYDFRVFRLAKKIEAGADFIQTQCIYNMERFREFMKQANDMGLTEKVYLLAGVTPMKSLGMARYMKKNVPGMDVPD